MSTKKNWHTQFLRPTCHAFFVFIYSQMPKSKTIFWTVLKFHFLITVSGSVIGVYMTNKLYCVAQILFR